MLSSICTWLILTVLSQEVGSSNWAEHRKYIIIIIIIIKTSHCESSFGSFDECRTAPSGRRPKTKPDDLGCESACTGCQKLHPPSPFIIITQPESSYSFYRPTQGRRLSRPSWLVTYRDGLPVQWRPLTESDMWLTEYCHWHSPMFFSDLQGHFSYIFV